MVTVLAVALGLAGVNSQHANDETGDADRERSAAPSPVLVEPASSGRSWYGWQMLAVDGANVGLALLAGRDFGPVAAVNLFAYLGSGPLVHAWQGNTKRAYGSLALRVGAPLVTRIAFEPVTDRGPITVSEEAEEGRSSLPLWRELLPLAGAPVAMAIDSLALGWTAKSDGSSEAGAYIAPTAAFTRDKAMLGLRGAF